MMAADPGRMAQAAHDLMAEQINDPRPFTSAERAEMMAGIDEVTRFIQREARWWNWATAASYALTFGAGFFMGGLPK